MESCCVCTAKASIEEAMEQGWTPYFWVGTYEDEEAYEEGPICLKCAFEIELQVHPETKECWIDRHKYRELSKA